MNRSRRHGPDGRVSGSAVLPGPVAYLGQVFGEFKITRLKPSGTDVHWAVPLR